jgi:hypothetical protein
MFLMFSLPRTRVDHAPGDEFVPANYLRQFPGNHPEFSPDASSLPMIEASRARREAMPRDPANDDSPVLFAGVA